jgi:hypothetical protein
VKYSFRFYPALAVMLIAASVQGLAQTGKDAQGAQEQAASPFPRIAYDERAWKPFESTEGGFTIAFPGKPGFQIQTVEAAIGNLFNKTYGLDIGVCFFAVSFADYPAPVPLHDKELINRSLDAGRDRALAGTGSKLISEAPLTLDGYIGRYVLSADGEGMTHNQSYVVGNRFYQVSVRTDDYRNSPAADQKFFKDLVNRFFTSFKLTRKAY